MRHIRPIFFMLFGACLFAVGLEFFLVPNQVVDGGIVGISIITAHYTGFSLSLLLIVLNLPFLLIGYKQIGHKFAIYTLIAILSGSFFTSLFHSFNPLTKDPLLAAIFGGIILGIGVGIVIRNGGSLDGSEITAILINKKVPFSVGEIVMFFNLFIFTVAGFAFDWDRALYSAVAYYIAFKMIDMTIEGFMETRSVWIISDHSHLIGDALLTKLGRGVTYFNGAGGYTGEDKLIVFVVITRLEEAALKSIVEEIDENAFIAFGHIHDVKGGKFKKKDIH